MLLSPVPTSPPALGGQTQTQLEHARIGELEQNLLLEKAQAERLLRELADNRVTAAASASARQRPCQRPRFIIFSLSGCSSPSFVGFLFLPFASLLGGQCRFRNVLLRSSAV